MSDLQKQLEDIKAQLSMVTKILPVVAELKVAYDNYWENQEPPPATQDDDLPTAQELPNLETPLRQETHSPTPTPQPSTSTATTPLATITATGVNPSIPTASPDVDSHTGITTLQQITGLIRNDETQIDATVASTISKVLTNGLEGEARSKLEQEIPHISNCPRIAVLACNTEVYRQAPTEVKAQDRDLQKVQKSMMAGLSILAQAFSQGHSEGLTDRQQGQMASALALVADASHTLDLCRRKGFKSSVKEEYKTLCTDEYPVEGMLFSEDLGEKVKAVADTNRISKSLSLDDSTTQRKRSFPFLGSRQMKAASGHRNSWMQPGSPQKQARLPPQSPYQTTQRSTVRGRGNQRPTYTYRKMIPQQQTRR